MKFLFAAMPLFCATALAQPVFPYPGFPTYFNPTHGQVSVAAVNRYYPNAEPNFRDFTFFPGAPSRALVAAVTITASSEAGDGLLTVQADGQRLINTVSVPRAATSFQFLITPTAFGKLSLVVQRGITLGQVSVTLQFPGAPSVRTPYPIPIRKFVSSSAPLELVPYLTQALPYRAQVRKIQFIGSALDGRNVLGVISLNQRRTGSSLEFTSAPMPLQGDFEVPLNNRSLGETLTSLTFETAGSGSIFLNSIIPILE